MRAVNKLAMNLATHLVDHRYFQFLVITQAVVTEVLRQFLAVNDRFSIALELNADPVPHRNAVFHVEEKLLHEGRSLIGVSRKPGRVAKQHAKRQFDLPMVIALWANRNGARVPKYLAARLDKIRDAVARLILLFRWAAGKRHNAIIAQFTLSPLVNIAQVRQKRLPTLAACL
jgi:hypothetical protein